MRGWRAAATSIRCSTNCFQRRGEGGRRLDATTRKQCKLLFTGSEWDLRHAPPTYDAIEEIALDELGLDIYPKQIEIITSEQMLDAYSSVGMPLMYRHWSFGKRFAHHETLYRKGRGPRLRDRDQFQP